MNSLDEINVPLDESISNFLAGRDMPCPQWEYNLRDLRGNRCPECGEVLVLRIGVAEPKQGMLIAGLVGLSAVAGFNGLLILFGIIGSVIHHDVEGQTRTFVSLGVGLLVSIVAIRVWLHYWKKIRRLSAAARGWLVLACWLLPVINIVALIPLL